MFVDTELLHSGGNQSHRAGGHAQEGADQLAGGTVASGMFGDFDAANDFHSAVAAAHGQHVKTLQGHSETLTGVGTKAHHAATGFTNMDSQNAAEMQALRPSSGPSTQND
ncbi:DUF2563 family protein [Mycobacterium mantenii]|uniref:DUF2563 domain-containing protein n=1 Tax=Mycobacterium mantenii TaxID=560555 RepID=A0A1A2TJN7_MYCNT|nr:DUF2563 family protein [Mycobacterium mantenii]OBH45494.1 hypothetical protein A5688_07600 [Mycobacterium mantenii]OBH57084.1 hypothetical protein A5687_25475 [Mycobacterium mantenii]OBH76570.1 hypothetical protein A5683_20765 [Mycobacterium mantenii]